MKEKILALTLVALCASPVMAKEGLMLGLGAGKGELDLDEGSNFPNADTDDEDGTRNALIG
ncbi:MAG TPA: hypothetical protein DIW43_02785, partial [Spongiibacteraceae bacterium]|nr:hypothetical protein [Spongiibacteraceae bacterium]